MESEHLAECEKHGIPERLSKTTNIYAVPVEDCPNKIQSFWGRGRWVETNANADDRRSFRCPTHLFIGAGRVGVSGLECPSDLSAPYPQELFMAGTK